MQVNNAAISGVALESDAFQRAVELSGGWVNFFINHLVSIITPLYALEYLTEFPSSFQKKYQ